MEAVATAGLLFGRDRELAQIHDFLDGATAGPSMLVLVGEPGIGKTTLWRAGIDAAHERGRLVLSARPAEAESDLSFSGLGDLLQPALARLERLPAPRRRALEIALLLTEAENGAPDARAVGLATLDLLRLLAEEGPVVLALDDTQWLDPPSREALAYGLRRLEDERIALLTACRPG
jgi:predicted ATPase